MSVQTTTEFTCDLCEKTVTRDGSYNVGGAPPEWVIISFSVIGTSFVSEKDQTRLWCPDCSKQPLWGSNPKVETLA